MGYPDVPAGDAYATAIDFVTDHGIMAGDEKGNFNPKAHVTLAELCVFLVQFFTLSEFITPTDRSRIPESFLEFAPYFNACEEAGLIPENFAERIGQDVSIDEMRQVLSRADKALFPFSPYWLSLDKFPGQDLTRGICAQLIYRFSEHIAHMASRALLNPDAPDLSFLLSFPDRYSWIPELASSDLYQIFSLLKSQKPNVPFRDQVEKFSFMRDICNLKQKFAYQGDAPLYHYTSLYALEKLTLPNAQFHLSNTACLNDPQEGLLGMNKLSKRSVLDTQTGKRWYAVSKVSSDVPVHPSFIASFMTKGDVLPMWVQYGSGGAGCCLALNPQQICEPLYSVTYSSKEINAFFRKIFDLLRNYHLLCFVSPLDSDPVFQYAKAILEQGCYLYKDASYKHEQEVRIITFAPVLKAKREAAPRPGEAFPRVYWETPLQKNRNMDSGLNFSSITLGPTVANPEQIAVALAQRGYHHSFVKKSKIKFR